MALASVGYIFEVFINKGGLAIEKLFKIAKIKVDNIKGVNKCDLR